MKNPVLLDIMKYAINKLNQSYGFCGVASGDDTAILNSTDKNGHDITIKIAVKEGQ